jgi:hypothetical protein
VRSRVVGPVGARAAVGITGAVAVVVGSLSPWATLAFGYPGKMTLSGFPGGARLFCLVLAAVAVLLVLDLPGRRGAGLAGATGILIVAAFNIVAMGAADLAARQRGRRRRRVRRGGVGRVGDAARRGGVALRLPLPR